MNEPGTRELDRGAPPGTVVPCPLKAGAMIGVGRCVEWQRDNGCNCEHALVSLRRVEELLAEKRSATSESAEDEEARVERLDEVRGLIARAEQIEKERPAKPAEENTMPHATGKCGWKEAPCNEEIRLGINKSGLCGRHSNLLRMRQKAGKPDKSVARRIGKVNGGGAGCAAR